MQAGEQGRGMFWGCLNSKTEERLNFCEAGTSQRRWGGRDSKFADIREKRKFSPFLPLSPAIASLAQDLEGIQTLSILGPKDRTKEPM